QVCQLCAASNPLMQFESRRHRRRAASRIRGAGSGLGTGEAACAARAKLGTMCAEKENESMRSAAVALGFLGILASLVMSGAAFAQEGQAPVAVAEPAELAFEQGRWDDAISEYREILAAYPEDRLSLLRIAQAQRELKRYDEALVTLEQARTANAPEAMTDFERARNLALLGRDEDALGALDAADHSGLRALALVESAPELARFRELSRYQRVYRNVRARVYPCEGVPEAAAFDFWLGRWEVRMPDGTLIGTNTITKRDGGCSIQERWEGAGGSTGTSVSFYLPSRMEWRQVWTGSSGTSFDITGTSGAAS